MSVWNQKLANYTDRTYQVWIHYPNGGFFLYRENLLYATAVQWADAFTKNPPAGAPQGATFVAVEATTTYKEVEV